ncbi:MAG: YihY/virulence factor BrkB family protein [Planctomycetota bacterium]
MAKDPRSIRKLVQALREQVVTALTQPRTQLTRGQRTLRYAIDLTRHARRELRDHSAATMAAALTYRTIFGLIPLMVMALIVFRAFGGFASTQEGLTERIYHLLDIDEEIAQVDQDLREELVEPGGLVSSPPPPGAPISLEFDPETPELPWGIPVDLSETQIDESELTDEERRALANAEMKQQVDEVIGQFADAASSIKLGSIGVVGMFILIWAALGLIVTVERTFNKIYNAPSGRPWHVRIPIYWAVITLGPVLIWASFYFSTQFRAGAAGWPIIGGLLGFADRFFALSVTWLLILILFKMMPNTKVAIRPAMIGAFVSAVAWEGMKAVLRWYIENAVISPTQSQLYGSLALIPLLLFWVYLTWMVLLAGLEITHLIQTLPASRMKEFERQAQGNRSPRDPWLVIPVLAAVADAFSRGQTTTVDELADRLSLPITTVAAVARALAQKGMLHELDQEDGQPLLLLAQPAERIPIYELVDSAHPTIANDAPGYDLLKQVAEAQRAALENARLGEHWPE